MSEAADPGASARVAAKFFEHLRKAREILQAQNVPQEDRHFFISLAMRTKLRHPGLLSRKDSSKAIRRARGREIRRKRNHE